MGHWPFGYWLTGVLAPHQTVELGTHSGNSLFCFAQSLSAHGHVGRIFAVDTWRGDEHAGQYTEDIYASVKAHADEFYSCDEAGVGICNVVLLRKTFDEGLEDFDTRSIDLLHIDGLHTYKAVRHDFESWLPKCSENAIVLFHDTQVRRDDFGVWKFWAEVKTSYAHFEFLHSNGLGVLSLGVPPTQILRELFESAEKPPECNRIRGFFSAVGTLMVESVDLQEQVQASHRELQAYVNGYAAERELRLHAEDQIQRVYASNSWRLTKPLRSIRRCFTGR